MVFIFFGFCFTISSVQKKKKKKKKKKFFYYNIKKKKKKKKNSIFDIPIEQSPHGCPIIPQIFCR